MIYSLIILGAVLAGSIAAYSYFSANNETKEEVKKTPEVVAEEEFEKIKSIVDMEFTEEEVLEKFPLPTKDSQEKIEQEKEELQELKEWNEENLKSVYKVFEDAVGKLDFPFMELVKEDVIRIQEEEKERLMKGKQLELREEQLKQM